MPTLLFVFEFIGTAELLVIALVALMIFGPRKLPEIGRKLGKGMADFKRASEDFKRTWEFEVETEQRHTASRTETENDATQHTPSSESEPHASDTDTRALNDAEPSSSISDIQTISRPFAEIEPDGPTPAPLTVARGLTTTAHETHADAAHDEERESADATAREKVG